MDGKLAIITDTFVIPANVHDSIVCLDQLDRQRRRFALDVRAVGLDAGYATVGTARGLKDRGILGVTGHRTPTPPGMMRKSRFVYEADHRCPGGQLLSYVTTGSKRLSSIPIRPCGLPLEHSSFRWKHLPGLQTLSLT